ncbi:RagB/SusD family nutrient uptake outer membrane protein [Flavobacteriaceae bacterium F08102]|nr:RagB/SusD family nutrient uptake outer membrane protein [Flavobacteriaceae bacterium F08102]
MKTTLKYGIILILLAGFTTSCDDFLDETSSAQITADDQFKEASGFKDALIGVYISMTQPQLYSRDMTYNLVDILSRQYAPLGGSALYSQIEQYNYRGVISTSQVDNLWIKSYNTIANINSALDAIDEKASVLSDIDYSIIKGELLGLRAFLHFDLMRLYGKGNLANRGDLAGEFGVPYVTTFGKEVTPRRSYEETFALLTNDLEEASELLKEDPIYTEINRPADYYTEVNRNGFYNQREQRMNYYAVKALQARVLAWQGGLANLEAAKNAAEEVINKSNAALIDASSYPVSSDPILYPEVLFALDVNALEDITIGYLNAATFNTNVNALYLDTSTANALYETSNSNIGVADIRFNTLLESQTRGLISTKLIQKSGLLNREKVPLIKLPEMYYIAAEYYIENNQLDLAIAKLNSVRQSRGIIEDIPETATQEELEDELLKEYRKEFVGEGQLFFAYKRLGLTTFPGLGATIADDDIYVLPIPDTEL